MGSGPAPAVIDAPVNSAVVGAGGHGQRRLELAGLGRRPHRGDPRRQVVGRPRSGTFVARRRRDEHPGGVCVEEGELGRVGERVGPARDREVDHVDAIEDCLLDGGGGVGVEAPLDAAHLVLDQVRPGSDAVDRPPLDTEDHRRVEHVAGGGARGVGAVPVRVTGGMERLRRRPSRVGQVGGEERMAADQLVVAHEGVVGRGERVVAEVAGTRRAARCRRRGAEVAQVGERLVLGPDTGVEVAVDDPGAGGVGAPEGVIHRAGGEEVGTRVGERLLELVHLDGDDAGDGEDVLDAVGRDDGGHAAVDDAEAAPDIGGRDALVAARRPPRPPWRRRSCRTHAPPWTSR